MTAELRMAATVLLTRDSPAGPEFFMVRRHGGAAFMAGAHVFPGGAVDEADRLAIDPGWCDGLEYAAAQIPMLDAAQAIAFHVAAVRELFEEAGVLLARDTAGVFVDVSAARFKQYQKDIHAGTLPLRDMLKHEGLRLAADALAVCAHWVTPPMDVRRFDTRFFVARLPKGQDPAHDDRETTESRWLTAAGAIAAAVEREIVLPPPTWVTLSELAQFQSVDSLLRWLQNRSIPRREPTLIERAGSRTLMMPGDSAYAGPSGATAALEAGFIWTADRWLPHQDERPRNG